MIFQHTQYMDARNHQILFEQEKDLSSKSPSVKALWKCLDWVCTIILEVWFQRNSVGIDTMIVVALFHVFSIFFFL